jgi:hypothetical protein
LLLNYANQPRANQRRKWRKLSKKYAAFPGEKHRCIMGVWPAKSLGADGVRAVSMGVARAPWQPRGESVPVRPADPRSEPPR